MKLILSILAIGLACACSHYQLPINRLETPEARGHGRFFAPARVEVLALQSGSDLIASPQRRDDASGAPTYHAQSAFTPAFGFQAAAGERIDVGVRVQPQAPLTFRFKYQFSGEPESRAIAGNTPFAFTIAPGILFGRGSLGSASLFSVDASVLGGYRLSSTSLISLSPFFGFASLSGVGANAGTIGVATPASGAGVSQMGAALGYQYSLEALVLRAELAWATGSIGEAKVGGFHAGALFGFAL